MFATETRSWDQESRLLFPENQKVQAWPNSWRGRAMLAGMLMAALGEEKLRSIPSSVATELLWSTREEEESGSTNFTFLGLGFLAVGVKKMSPLWTRDLVTGRLPGTSFSSDLAILQLIFREQFSDLISLTHLHQLHALHSLELKFNSI